MVASCNDCVSADIPVSLQKLAKQAAEDFGDDFKNKPAEEALEVLEKPGTKSHELFQRFRKIHGHRCLHEVSGLGLFTTVPAEGTKCI